MSHPEIIAIIQDYIAAWSEPQKPFARNYSSELLVQKAFGN